jgi:hypothetical protein
LHDDPFVAPSGGRMDEIIRAVRDCPSGALSFALDGVEARAGVDYHATRPARIEVSKDGPYRVSGSKSVSRHAEAILARLREGTMPCDGAWPSERIDVFARWVAAGKPE